MNAAENSSKLANQENGVKGFHELRLYMDFIKKVSPQC